MVMLNVLDVAKCFFVAILVFTEVIQYLSMKSISFAVSHLSRQSALVSSNQTR